MTPSTTDRNFVQRTADRITCLQVLNFMVILGFMFNYMLRVNLTIAIVDMVSPINSTSYVFNETTNETDTIITQEPLYHWDKYQQNYILGCFFWGYVLTELPGGRLSEVIGARRVFGFSMLAASLITLATPIAADMGYIAVIILRILLGLFLGASWPSIPPMAAKWVPPMERSKFIANMMASSLGAAITMPICGYLIFNFGWASVFYSTGIVGLIWSVAWFYYVFDSPSQHPRISIAEKNYIENAIEEASGGGKMMKPTSIPWSQILRSAPVWAIVITHGCSVFGYFTVVNQLPTYMKDVLSFKIKENGLFSSLPYFGKYVMAVLASWLADSLRRRGKLTTTQTRKIFTSFAVLLPAVMMVAQALFGKSALVSVTIFTCSLTFNGAVTAGYLANGLDIAPNFSGTIFGMANTLSSIGGFVSAFMVAALTNEAQTYEQWKWVFWILVVVYLFGGITYLIFGSGVTQPWNSVQRKSAEDGTEEVPLNKVNNKENT